MWWDQRNLSAAQKGVLTGVSHPSPPVPSMACVGACCCGPSLKATAGSSQCFQFS